jgi:3-deoxy-7-phosphoheptulonate synthase/chorismate mutase
MTPLMEEWGSDPVVVELRERIDAADRTILETVNERLGLVEELRRYKDDQGYPFLDRSREDLLLARLAEQNRGPLSETGVRELFASLLELVKRELDGRT